MILVLDASSLIVLSSIGRLDLLRQMGHTLYVPEGVYHEVVTRGEGRPGSRQVAQAPWLIRVKVRDQPAVDRFMRSIGRGEAEAIVLAKEIGADAIVLDDGTARRIAERESRTVLGLLGLLLHGKQQGMVPAIKPLLDQIVATGFFIDEALYRRVLHEAGEEL